MKLIIFGLFVAGVAGQIVPYIGNGNTVWDFREIPYMLSLRENNTHICGAVIIKPGWGLTTVNCVKDTTTGLFRPSLTVKAGSVDRKKGGYVLNVNGFRIHPNYNKNTGEYNFAMFRVRGTLPPALKPPTLPPCYTEPAIYDDSVIYGWGTDDKFGDLSDNLLRGEIYIMPRLSCNSIPYNNRIEGTNNAKFICAASFGVYSCTGDEGGPLVVNDVLVGITTYRKGCSDPHNPSVFGNIGNYLVRQWIDKSQ